MTLFNLGTWGTEVPLRTVVHGRTLLHVLTYTRGPARSRSLPAAAEMARSPPRSVPLLTPAQIGQFKRDGVLILPRVLDPHHCERIVDEMWDTISRELPRMRRNAHDSWYVTEEEAKRFVKAPGELDPYFSAQPGRVYVPL